MAAMIGVATLVPYMSQYPPQSAESKMSTPDGASATADTSFSVRLAHRLD